MAQATLAVAGATGKTGAVVSCTVNVAVVDIALPHASVAVKVTVAESEQLFEMDVKLFVHVTVEQESDAAAPPLLASHVFKDPVFP